MNKKLIEYLIIATALILLIYGCYTMISYSSGGYDEVQNNVTDSITMYYPSSSGYAVAGNTVEFRNELYDFYNMDVSKLSSSDEKVKNLLNHFSSDNHGTVDYKNETCYLLTVEFEDDNGFKSHSMIIPVDSFDKSSLSFKDNATVYLFDGKDRGFVVDSAFNSQVVI